MAETQRQHRETATYMWNKCLTQSFIPHSEHRNKVVLTSVKNNFERFHTAEKSFAKLQHLSNKMYPGNSYCNRSNPRATFTSVVNKKKTFNKVFKFYTVSDTSRKEIQLPVLYKKLYEISRQGISQAYHLIWYVTIWSFYLKNIFNNILSSNVLQILVIKVSHCYFLYSPEFPTYLLLCRFLCIQTERT